MDQRRRRTFSFLLPVVGLVITVPELFRLMEARRVAEACVAQAGEQGACPPGPDLLFFLIAGAFGLVFLGRLVFLTYEYLRSQR
jgi:hypothetical protein